MVKARCHDNYFDYMEGDPYLNHIKVLPWPLPDDNLVNLLGDQVDHLTFYTWYFLAHLAFLVRKMKMSNRETKGFCSL